MNNLFIGIDVSAKTLDICIKKGKNTESHIIKNSVKSIKDFFNSDDFNTSNVIVAMENTGEYNNYLYKVFEKKKEFSIFVINPYHISKSIGLTRGKNDKVDAIRIAKFIEKNYQDLEQWEPLTKEIEELKILYTERKHLVGMIAVNKQKIKSLSKHKNTKSSSKVVTLYKNQIKRFMTELKYIEKLMEDLINKDEELKQKSDLVKSVPGVGKVLCWQLICKTNGFTKYTDPRKLACCAGVVPFSYTSGTSIHSKNRVSKMADLKLKSTLQMAAMRAIQMKNDLQNYYLRKVEQGKNKMSVLNAVRNKIIHIVIAVVKNQKKYQNRLVVS